MTRAIVHLGYAIDRASGRIACYARDLLSAYQRVEFPLTVLNLAGAFLNGNTLACYGHSRSR
jgi:hypothetical protein